MRVRLFSSSGFVIEEMDIAVANLEKVNVAGDNVALDLQVESARAVIADVLPGQKMIPNGYVLFLPALAVKRCRHSVQR